MQTPTLAAVAREGGCHRWPTHISSPRRLHKQRERSEMEPGSEEECWVEAPPGRCLFLAARALLSLGTCAPSGAPTSRGCRRIPCPVVDRIEGEESLGRVGWGQAEPPGGALSHVSQGGSSELRSPARTPLPHLVPRAPTCSLLTRTRGRHSLHGSRFCVSMVAVALKCPRHASCWPPCSLYPLLAGPSHRAARGTAPGQGSRRAPTAAAQGPPCSVAAITHL